ncbi:MAG: hypothetical protein E6X17_06040 [Sporomusaceae bacterium]|nr:hypothetical protein [Sporomusaceae bacterium]
MLSIVSIQPVQNYTFSSKIQVDGQSLTLQFELQYNELAGYWLATVRDASGNDLITSLPVIPAQNLLEQYAYLGIGSAYIVPAQTVREQWPSLETLGSDWYLVWGDTDGGDVDGG